MVRHNFHSRDHRHAQVDGTQLRRQVAQLRSVMLAAGDQMWTGAADRVVHDLDELAPLLREMAELIGRGDADAVRELSDTELIGVLGLAQLGLNELLARAIDRAMSAGASESV